MATVSPGGFRAPHLKRRFLVDRHVHLVGLEGNREQGDLESIIAGEKIVPLGENLTGFVFEVEREALELSWVIVVRCIERLDFCQLPLKGPLVFQRLGPKDLILAFTEFTLLRTFHLADSIKRPGRDQAGS